MRYAKVENGAITEYPYDHGMLRKDNPNTSFPKDSLQRADIRSDYGVVEVAEVSKPQSDTHKVSEGTPALVSGNWTQTWDQVAKTAEELSNAAVSARSSEYGMATDQIEFITENGLEAWQAKVAEIKARHPK